MMARWFGREQPKMNPSTTPPSKPRGKATKPALPPAAPSGVSQTCCDCGCGKQVR